MADRRLFAESEQFYARAGEADSACRVATVVFVTADWFGAAGLRSLSGRLFTAGDRTAPVVVINESLARLLDATGPPAIGSSLRTTGFQRNSRFTCRWASTRR